MVSTYQHVIESLTFTMGDKGIFDVTVDGETLFSKHRVGRHANDGEVLELFKASYGAGVPVYGS